MQIECYCNLYVSRALETKKNRILLNLMERKWQRQIYVITLAQGEQNHLEFFSSLLLQQRIYNEKRMFVVGLAESYDAAAELVAQILQDVLDETGGTDIRRYILETDRMYHEKHRISD